MQNDPPELASRQNQRFQSLGVRFVTLLVVIVVSTMWILLRKGAPREPELPNRPFTKADVPLLAKKVESLKHDADTAHAIYRHLNDKAEIKIANQAWEDLYYTPEVFPAAAKLRRCQNARILELRPDLAAHVRARMGYEQGRYAIANDPAITDKAAAIAGLEKRLGPAINGPEYQKSATEAASLLSGLIGDPTLDQAEQQYWKACETAVLKRHPELAEYYHEMDNRNAAYQFFMGEANGLSRKIKELENGASSVSPVITPPAPLTTVANASDANDASDAGPASPPTNTPAKLATPPPPTVPPPPVLPEEAASYGVKVGDTVEISALKPVIAIRHAVITAMDTNQLTVRAGVDTFTVQWKDVAHLRTN